MLVKNTVRRGALVASVAMLVSAGGSAAARDLQMEFAPQYAARTLNVAVAKSAAGSEEVVVRSRYIIGLRQAPLALASDLAGVSLPRLDNERIDVRSPEARGYVGEVVRHQQEFLAEASSSLGRAIAPAAPHLQFQHAFNGMVLDLSESEAHRLAQHPDVFLVEAERELPVDTDAGPTVIGAPGIWDGSSVFGNLATRGEGTVVGIIDTGINLASPSFAAVGPSDGYVHQNPLGSGVFLGWCNPSHPNHNPARDICNDKLIGGWDFADAPATGQTTLFEAPGFEDDNGHGTHTASTAAGNVRNGVSFNGIVRNISGVAPHANIIAYDVCYTIISTGQGSCPNTATLAAANQVLADGIVDVVNFSIGGGASPWNEAGALAFLALQNAGVLVSASAGNAGPGPNTLGHLSPWVMTVAASSHTRVFGFNFSLNGPAAPPPPANTQNITVRPGGAPIANVTVTAPIIVSPNFGNGSTDGCAPYPADTFRQPANAGGTQGIAVLRLDGNNSACASGARRTAALNAGAAAVLFVDATPLNLGANNLTYSMLLADWNNVAAHIALDPSTASATIAVPLAAGPGTPDVIANFSSRGPNGFSLLKPDVAAPGLEILASYTRWVSALPRPFGGAVNPALNGTLNAISGTSMAAPHNAGAAALLRSLNRSWTPAQIKSALVTTAKVPMTKQDGITPSDPFDRGSGRIDLSRAAKAGLIMDETGANFTAANPAIGGNPAQLNLPSFQNLSCVGTCTFARNVRSTRTAPVTWTATVTGLPAGVASVTPSSFSLANSASTNFTLNVDSLQLPAGQVSFGEVVLTPSNATIPTARMAIAVQPGVPDIAVTPAAINLNLAAGASTTVPVTIANAGNPTLTWSEDTAGLGSVTQLVQPNNGANGFSTNFYNNQVPTPGGVYMSEDHTPADSGQLRRFRVEGFMTGAPANALQVQASAITFKVYADDGGKPAGNPEAGSAGEVYSCVRTPAGPNSTGLSFLSADGAVYQLDAALAATAGCPTPPTLQAGTRYWFTAFPSVNSTSAQRRWVWFRSSVNTGLGARAISPLGIGGFPPAWASMATLLGLPAGEEYDFALTVALDVQCGASWFDLASNGDSLGVGGQTSTTLAIDSTGLPVGTSRGFLCLDTNGTDPDEAQVVVPVTLGVLENADLELSAAAASPLACGADAVVDFTVENNGPTASSNVTFAATLPAGVTFVSLTGPAGWTCDVEPVAGVASCTNPSLAAAATETLVLTTTPQAAACGGNRNFAATVSAASDGVAGNNSAAALVAIDAANVAPQFGAATYAFGVPAQPANGQFIGSLTATDADAGDVLTYSIIGGNTGTAFALDPSTGAITIATSAAVTAANSPFTLTVQVSDGSLTDTATVTITVLPDMIFSGGFEGS